MANYFLTRVTKAPTDVPALLEAAERNLIKAERNIGTPTSGDYAALATAYATIAIARSTTE